jgi:hypothetical protein
VVPAPPPLGAVSGRFLPFALLRQRKSVVICRSGALSMAGSAIYPQLPLAPPTIGGDPAPDRRGRPWRRKVIRGISASHSEEPDLQFDRNIHHLSNEELSQALDEALTREETELVWKLVDEIERRGGGVEI